jgi:16S rRNA (uracil1498-N3)-methyltransferase
VTPRFYCPLPLAPGAIIDLPSGAAHHATRVLRLQAGAALTLFNGEGGEFEARLERADGRGVSARIDAWHGVERESPLAVTLIHGLASAERMDYAVQKAVELGAAAIASVVTARSVTRLDAPRAEKRLLHWQQIAIAACEQCGRNRVPLIHPIREFGDWLTAPSAAALRLLLAGDASQSLADLGPPRGAIEILAGPEGGLEPGETAAAWRTGFRPVRLGPRTLRAETAGLAAMAALNALWGDWC